jgi:REP element-mobilizing transposase RayT
MVLGYHVIFTAYGFWLPNDPRGSWSDFVRSWELLRFGPATKTDERRSVAGVPHDRAARLAAKAALRYPPVEFSGLQARSVGDGFALFAKKSGLTVWACSVLPKHVHMVIARHRFKAEQVVNLLKGASTRKLIEDQRHPLTEYTAPGQRVPRCWASRCWKVYLDSADDIWRAIQYVEENPLKEGLKSQTKCWEFVTTFPGLV